MSDLFSFINSMTSKPEEFKKTKAHERARHFFMVNRLCSICFPIQAAYFNHIKINPAQAVTFWQGLLSQKYNRTPNWMYVKTAKAKEEKKAAQAVSDEVIKKYCEVYKVSHRDVESAIRIMGAPMIDELTNFAHMTKA